MKLFLLLIASNISLLPAQDSTSFCGKLKTVIQVCNDNRLKEIQDQPIYLSGARKCYVTLNNRASSYFADFDETEDSKYDFMPKLLAIRKQVKLCLAGWNETKTVEEESAMMESARELETNTYDMPEYSYNSNDKKVKAKVSVLMQRDSRVIKNKAVNVFVVRLIVFQ
jgi:hypothetical protein